MQKHLILILIAVFGLLPSSPAGLETSGRPTLPSWSYKETLAGTGTFAVVTIPGGYTNLRINISGRLSVTVNVTYLRFNGDTGGNYRFLETLNSAGTVTGADSGAGATACRIGAMSGTDSTANYDGAASAVIPNYANTTFFKRVISGAGWMGVGSATNTELSVGTWASTSAITSVTVLTSYVAGSTITVIAE